jgi:tetratricopeptide (TPR) repeat protein
MGADVHVWQPPLLASTVGKRVAVAPTIGPRQLAETIHQRLLDGAPREPGRETELIDAAVLESESPFRLTAARDGETSDVALAALARQRGVDFTLRGEILPSRRGSDDPAPSLKVSWQLHDLGRQRGPQGRPVVVDLPSAVRRYPDLAVVTDRDAALATAAARETHRLITPSVTRTRAQLAIPYLLPGSRRVREGNAHARSGDWATASQIWEAALEENPWQLAAVHNLAIAAVAAQDFARARQLARRAARGYPTGLARRTLVWVELMQRQYHEAFGLAEPPEGWAITRDVPID